MANEITILSGISVSKSGLKFSYSPGGYQVDMTGLGGPTPGFVTIGTTEEEVQFTELSTAGFVIIQNLDTTNYVRWGFSTGVYGGRVRPGETAGPFRLNPGASLFMIANAADCKMIVYGFEN